MGIRTIQIKRGNTDTLDSYTGASGELTYDKQLKEIRLHDGSTEGGLKFGISKNWGEIGGTISEQGDLQELLDTKSSFSDMTGFDCGSLTDAVTGSIIDETKIYKQATTEAEEIVNTVDKSTNFDDYIRTEDWQSELDEIYATLRALNFKDAMMYIQRGNVAKYIIKISGGVMSLENTYWISNGRWDNSSGNTTFVDAEAITASNFDTTIFNNYLKDVDIIGEDCLYYVFYNTLTSGSYQVPDFSKLKNIEAYGMTNCFYGCKGLTGTPDLSNITSVGEFGLYATFYGCTGLTGDVYFNNLESLYINYGSGVLTGLDCCFEGCENINSVHFPASLDSELKTLLTNEALFGNNTSTKDIPVLFDL